MPLTPGSSQETMIAYLAGLFDGEGSVGSASSRHCPTNFRVQARIAMCDRAPVQRFADVFGGRVTTLKKPTKTGKPIYQCSYYCRNAADVLEAMLPYLTAKHDRARDAIILARMMKTPRRQFRPVPAEDLQRRVELAAGIKAANFGSNGRIARYAA